MGEHPPQRSQLAITVIALRSRKKLSHEILARRATKLAPPGVTVSAKTIGNIEADRHSVTLGKLRALAAALEVEVWQLFLPPAQHPELVRDVAEEISRRNEEDQRDILKLIRKLPVIEVDEAPKPNNRPTLRKAAL